MKRFAVYTVASGHIDQMNIHSNIEEVQAICAPTQAVLEMPDGVLENTHKVVDGEFVEL